MADEYGALKRFIGIFDKASDQGVAIRQHLLEQLNPALRLKLEETDNQVAVRYKIEFVAVYPGDDERVPSNGRLVQLRKMISVNPEEKP